MVLAGTFKLVPDEPGNICVVIFPDQTYKYASSIKKHIPKIFGVISHNAALTSE